MFDISLFPRFPLEVAIQAGGALAAAHQAGIIQTSASFIRCVMCCRWVSPSMNSVAMKQVAPVVPISWMVGIAITASWNFAL
jgi:hypothetical protein